MAWCIPKHLTSKFLTELRNGNINPEKLMSMTSEQRRVYFDKLFGEELGTNVNRTFEGKLLLKNQQRGIINWAQNMAGLKPEIQKDLVTKVNNMTELLNPANEQAFLKEYASYKLGTNVTMAEAKNISEFAKIAADKKNEMNQGGDRLEYGYAKVAFDNYLNELKGNTAFEKFMRDIKNPKHFITEVAGVAKSAKSTLDNSALLRQGWRVALTHPSVWFKNSLRSFQDIARTLGNKPVMDGVKADIVSRPNYDLYVKEKLDIGVIEESFPASAVIEKIPVIGRLHKASQNAFTAFQYRNRADLFDLYKNIADKSGGDIQGIGLLVNSLTARGKLGTLEGAAKPLNNLFFAPRLLKSHIDVLTGHVADYGNMSPFVKKQAAINLAKIISANAAILALADALKVGSVEWDPRSSDFGQVKVGDTRFDLSGGMRGIATLATRLLKNSTKSAAGKIYELGTNKFGSMDRTDVVYNFFENKLSPAASVVKDLMKGHDFERNKITLGGELRNLFEPLPISTFIELNKNPNSANIILAMIAEGLGISANTYSSKKKIEKRKN